MSEFKVGDRVRTGGYKSGAWEDDLLTGIITGHDVEDDYYEIDADMPYHTPQVLRSPERITLVSTDSTPDPVNHPAHYTQFPVEVIDITEHLSFNLGNVVKYACRAGRKDGADPIEDLRKMLWYGQRELERLQKEAAK